MTAKAMRAILDDLQRQRKSRIPITGCTRSQFPDAVFAGYWWSETRSTWDAEHVLSCMIDDGFPLDNRPLARTLGRLRQVMAPRYAQYGSVQEDMWIIAQRVERYS